MQQVSIWSQPVISNRMKAMLSVIGHKSLRDSDYLQPNVYLSVSGKMAII
jgi:hypothetical protein